MTQPEVRAKLTLDATVSPSEDPEKVLRAMKNVVGESECETSTDSHSARLVTEDPRALAHVRDQLRDRHVRSAARKQMLLKSSGRSTSLILNRQAAAASVVALCGSPDESPLGPVNLVIESERIEAVMDWLTAYAG